MIATEFYTGQGLGNQLWVYVVARILAEKKGCDFSILAHERFKGQDFINLDFGQELIGGSSPEGGPPFKLPRGIEHYYRERKEVLRSTTVDISRADPGLLAIAPKTKFDGVCQSTKYIAGYEDKIREWIKIKPEPGVKNLGDHACVLHVRCGDFMKTDAFMKADYYINAMNYLKTLDPQVVFYCVTDQKEVVETMLPGIPIIGSTEGTDNRKAKHHFGGNIGVDFRFMLNVPYLIIPPSSFSWWAAYLNPNKKIVIAPKYWARHNISDGFWSTYDMVTPGFLYMDKLGNMESAEDCQKEKEAFELGHQDMFNANIFENNMTKIKSRFMLSLVFLAKKILKKLGIMPRLKGFWYAIHSTTQKIVLNDSQKQELAQHRSKIKIFDCFLFFNELELLEIRFNILDPYVDYFVIVESTQKFSGGEKPLYYKDNKERFKKWSHKIIHYIVSDTPNSDNDPNCDQEVLALANTSSNVPRGEIHWLREFYQKEMIKKALVGHAEDNDVCFISDIDEIWNPEIMIDFQRNVVYKMRQKMYSYYLNNRSNEKWAGTYATLYKNIRNNSINHLDTASKTAYVYVNNGGWHFTSIGGVERVKEKIESYGHQEFNTEKVKNALEENITHNKDFIGRNFKLFVDERDLPDYLLKNKDTYRALFK
jgi:beta-1,4-mannosyl-glycoprotein beta-1,4-N-acetylglucosaminyltransferase